MRRDIPAAKWVVPEQLHLTLSFLGEQEDATTNRLITELKSIRASSFDLSFGQTGSFPNQRHPRVLWVGIRPEPLLNSLAEKIMLSLTFCGIPPEDRPYSPHITLARIRQQASTDIHTFLDQSTDKLPGFAVQEFILFQSRLTEEGALHTPVEKFELLPHS